MQRINRQNTIIENYLIPLAGTTAEEKTAYYCQLFRPYEEIIFQFEGALLLHNIPLYVFIIFLCFAFIYITYLIEISPFPTFLYFISLIPAVQLAKEIGCFTIFKSMMIKLPDLPKDSPNRIRTLEEIFNLLHPCLTLIWRIGYFIYHTILFPNIVDTIALFTIIVLLGLISIIVSTTVIIGVFISSILFLPTILTRNFVYTNIMYHLGNPFPEMEHEKIN